MTTRWARLAGSLIVRPRSKSRPPHIRSVELTLALCAPLVITVALIGMIATGAFAPQLGGPGEFVMLGLPVTRALHDAAATVTIGLLIVATFVLPGHEAGRGEMSSSQAHAVRLATWSACGWLATALGGLVFTAATVIGAPVTSPKFDKTFGYVATHLEVGQTLLVSAACIAVVVTALVIGRRMPAVVFATVAGLAALLPLALAGHAANSGEHGNAVNSMAAHLLGVTVWVGGLVGIIVVRNRLGTNLSVAVSRYSALAGWAFAAVAGSGIINATLRVGSAENLLSPYSALIIAKGAMLALLGYAGWIHRKRLIPRLHQTPDSNRAFIQLAVGEVVVMAIAMGVSVAVSRSAPPIPQTPLDGVDGRQGLLGFPYPPDVSAWRVLTEVHVDWLWLALGVVAASWYVVAVRRLMRRGDRWPLSRMIAWLAGCAGLIYFTSGGPGVYGAVHFSTHMIQHMGLMMVVPPLLVLGGPVSLALRTLPTRHDNSGGPREWLVSALHSRAAHVFVTPAVAAILFAGSLIAFYYTDWFAFSLRTHQGHILMCIHFLVSGYAFYWVLIGVDPGPQRPSFPLRIMILLATLAFHAFFGLAIMSQTSVLAIDWWHALHQTDDPALLADQRIGGGIAWGAAEIPTVLVALMVVRQWISSDERAAARFDRSANRTRDTKLTRYNDQLGRLASRDRSGGTP